MEALLAEDIVVHAVVALQHAPAIAIQVVQAIAMVSAVQHVALHVRTVARVPAIFLALLLVSRAVLLVVTDIADRHGTDKGTDEAMAERRGEEHYVHRHKGLSAGV